MLKWILGYMCFVFFSVVVSLGYMQNSRIAGSYGSFIPRFLRNFHTVLHSDYNNYHSWQCKKLLFSSHPFLHTLFSVYTWWIFWWWPIWIMHSQQQAQNAVPGWNLRNNKMISINFQSKLFSITVTQVYAPTTNAKEVEVKWFCEDLQNFWN